MYSIYFIVLQNTIFFLAPGQNDIILHFSKHTNKILIVLACRRNFNCFSSFYYNDIGTCIYAHNTKSYYCYLISDVYLLENIFARMQNNKNEFPRLVQLY